MMKVTRDNFFDAVKGLGIWGFSIQEEGIPDRDCLGVRVMGIHNSKPIKLYFEFHRYCLENSKIPDLIPQAIYNRLEKFVRVNK